MVNFIWKSTLTWTAVALMAAGASLVLTRKALVPEVVEEKSAPAERSIASTAEVEDAPEHLPASLAPEPNFPRNFASRFSPKKRVEAPPMEANAPEISSPEDFGFGEPQNFGNAAPAAARSPAESSSSDKKKLAAPATKPTGGGSAPQAAKVPVEGKVPVPTTTTPAKPKDTTPPVAPVASLQSTSPTNDSATKITLSSCSDFAGVFVSTTATAPLATASGWQTCSTNAGAILHTLSTEGNNTLYIWSKDATGNVSATSGSVTVAYDTTPSPVPLPIIDTSSPTGTTTVELHVTSCTDTDSVFVELNNSKPLASAAGWQPCSTVANALTGTLVTEGNIPFYVWSKDALGNVSATAGSASIIYDHSVPAAPALTLDTTTPTNVAVARMHPANCTDTTHVLLSTSNVQPAAAAAGWQACGTAVNSLSFTLSTEGSTTLYAWAKDVADNVSLTAGTVTVVLDQTLPGMPIPTLDSGTPTTVSTATLHVANCTDTSSVLIETANVRPAVTDAGWQTCGTTASSLTYTLTTEGSTPLYVWARDAAGNISLTSGSVTVYYDQTAPLAPVLTRDTNSPTNVAAAGLHVANCTDTASILFTTTNSRPAAGAAGWQACGTGASSLSYTLTTEGPLTLYAWAKDSTGNVSATAGTATVVYDITLPATPSPTLDSATPTSSASVSLHVANCTDTSSIFIELTNSQPTAGAAGWQACGTAAASLAFTLVSEGSHTLYVWAKDAAGNVSLAAGSVSVSLDQTLPAAPVLSLDTGTPTNVAAAGFHVANCTDTTSILLELTNTRPSTDAAGWQTCGTSASSLAYTLSAQGVNTLYAWAKDSSGNVSLTSGNASVTYDTTPPATPSPTLDTGTPTNASAAGFHVANCTNTSDILVTTTNSRPPAGAAGWQTCGTTASALSYTLPNQGSNTFYIWAKDAAGNVSLASGSLTVSYDNVLPATPALTRDTASPTNVAASAYHVANCTDTTHILLELSNVQPAAGAAGWQACGTTASALAFTLTVEGVNTIYAWAKDASGNVSALAGTASVTYDITPPATPSPTLDSGTPTNSSSMAFHVANCTDTSSILVTTANTQPSTAAAGWQGCGTTASALTHTLSTEGSNTFYIWAKDAAGNVSLASASLAVNYDSTVPSSPTLILDTSTPTNVAAAGLHVSSCTDTATIMLTTTNTQPAAGAAGWQTCGSSASDLSYTLTAEGPLTLYAWAKDSAGNVSTTSSNVSLTYDITPPATPSVTLDSGTPTKSSTVGIHTANCTDTSKILISTSSTPPAAGAAGWQNCSTTASAITFTLSSEGSTTLYVWAKDAASNVSLASSSFPVVLDQTPPGVAFPILDSATPTNSSTVDLHVADCTDTAAIFLETANSRPSATDSGWQTCSTTTASLHYTLTLAGTINIYAWAKDALGNVTLTANHVTVVYDTTPSPVPNVTRSTPSPTNNATVGMTVADCTDIDQVIVTTTNTKPSSGAAGWSSCSTAAGALQHTLTADGTYTLYVWSKDATGNVSNSAATISVVLDTSVPAAPNVARSSSSPTNSPNVTMTVSSCSGLSDIFVKTTATPPSAGDAGWQTCSTVTSAITHTLSAQGSYTLYVFSKNAAGSVSAAATLSVVYNTTSPVVSLTSFTGGSTYKGGSNYTITWTASDDIALTAAPITVQYSTNGGTSWTDISTGELNDGTYTWALPSINSTTIRVKVIALDTQGNQGTDSSASNLSIDSSAPTFSAGAMSIQQGAAVSTKKLNVSLTAVDNMSNITGFCLKYVNSPPASDSACWKSVATDAGLTPSTTLALSNYSYWIGEPNGSYTVYGWVRDALGHISALTNSGSGTAATDKASTTLTFACPYTLPGSVSVAHAYTGYPKWNDYLRRTVTTNKIWNQTTVTACVGNGSAPETRFTSCFHAGIIKKVAVTGADSCYGLTAADSLGVYEWECDDSTGTATFYSTGVKKGKGLRNLVNAASWKTNEVTVTCGASTASSSGTTWYSNTVTALPDNSTSTDSYIKLDGTDDDGAGPDAAYATGTVFTLASSRSSTGYNLNLSNASIVTLPGATLNFISTDANADTVPDVKNMVNNNSTTTLPAPCAACDKAALIAVPSAKFTWIEGDFKGGSTVIPDYLISGRAGQYQRYQNLNLTTYGAGMGVVLSSSGHTLFEDVRVNCMGGAALSSIGIQFGGTTFSTYANNIAISNCGTGIYDYGPNTVIRNSIISNAAIAIYDRSGTDHIYSQVVVTNSNTGIQSVVTSNTWHFVNVFNSASYALLVSNASKHTMLHNLAINNATGLRVSANSTGYFENSYFNNAVEVQLIGNSDYNIFGSKFYVSNNCRNTSSGTSNNLDVTTVSGAPCTKSDGSTAFGTSSDPSASFKGMIASTDAANGSSINADGTKSYASITDWANFSTMFRLFGKHSTSPLFNTDQTGYCVSPNTCHVWDLSLDTGDSVFKNKSGNGVSANSTWEMHENCPTEVSGNQTVTDTSTTPITFLKNAIEITNDWVGNENGLCESGERCIYAPNFASAYQGSGDYTTQTCVFQNGTVTDVTMYKYPTN